MLMCGPVEGIDASGKKRGKRRVARRQRQGENKIRAVGRGGLSATACCKVVVIENKVGGTSHLKGP